MQVLETPQAMETIELVKALCNRQVGNPPLHRKILHALRLRAVRFRPVLVDSELRLRICRLRDLVRLKERFDKLVDQKHFLRATDREAGPFGSLISFRRWLKSTFNLFYLMEIGTEDRWRVTGFVGFYGLRAEERLWLSLAIFDADYRRRGYGGRAVRLVSDYLQQETGITQVWVEVAAQNHAALTFFRTCSFRPKGESALRRPRPLQQEGSPR